MLEAMRKTIESVPQDAAPAQRAVIEEELTAAHAAIQARLARAANGYAIAAGAGARPVPALRAGAFGFDARPHRSRW